jgi:hypothetical protein
MRALEG